MLTQTQWKVQQLAESIRNTATNAAIVAANLTASRKPMVREHAIVAEETRTVAIKIMKALEENIYGGLSDTDFGEWILEVSKQTAFLALNAALVAGKVREHKAMAVIADELCHTAVELGELFGKSQKFREIPVVSPRSKVISTTIDLFFATSGSYKWCENALFVQEILNYCPQYIENKRLVLNTGHRDLNVPLIQLGAVPEDAGILIISDAYDPQKLYAVVAEFQIHSLCNSHIGVSKTSTADIPVRECWAASDGSDILFPDWEKLTS